jgi:ferric-dicitrate binding protein FerR (iron transport regulator)
MIDTKKIAGLLLKHLQHTLTDTEKTELNSWIERSAGNRARFEEMVGMESLLNSLHLFEEAERAKKKLSQQLHPPSADIATTVRLAGNRWKQRLSVAAVALVLVTGIVWWRLPGSKKQPVTIATVAEQAKKILPGTNKAILTLADGRQVAIGDHAGEMLAEEGNTKIFLDDTGIVTYRTPGHATHEKPIYNTIATPRGGQFRVVLSDGTVVWLNAASTLHFPTNFTGSTREVTLTGEGYFEVAKNTKPFKVTVELGGQGERDKEPVVEVLGTAFNIMAYADEQQPTTTLVEGAVRVSNGQAQALLKPGQQAKINGVNSIRTVEHADIEGATAWKNGLFQFNDNSVEAVLRQISRWYNIEIEYAGSKPGQHFSGSIRRNMNLSGVIQLMELNDVHFRIEGNKLIVQP